MVAPIPRAPVQRQRKFSALRGATSARSSNTMRPTGRPPISMSMNTCGLGAMTRPGLPSWRDNCARNRSAGEVERGEGGTGHKLVAGARIRKAPALPAAQRNELHANVITAQTRFAESK